MSDFTHTSTPDLFAQALALQKAGNGEAALRVYDKILKVDSKHADSLHMIGVLLAQSRRYRKAKKFLRLALNLQPDNPGIQTGYAVVLGRLGDFEACMEGLYQVIEIFPEYAEAFYQLGRHHSKLADLESAVNFFSHAIALDNGHADACLECAEALQQLGLTDMALQCCDQAVAISPEYLAEAAVCRGRIFSALGQTDIALAAFQQANAANPENLSAGQQLAALLRELGQTTAATDQEKANAQLSRQRGEIRCAMAQKFLEEEEYESALELLDEAVLLQPASRRAHYLRAGALNCLGHAVEALGEIEQTKALGGEDFATWIESAAILRNLNRFDESLALLERVVSLHPKSMAALINKVRTLWQMGRLDAALAAADRGLKIDPGDTNFLFEKSLMLLLKGDLPKGFRLYECRWQTRHLSSEKPNFKQPLWTGGQSLTGKTILLHAEQGLGDTLQFYRYLQLVKPLAGHVVFAMRKELMTLLKPLDAEVDFVPLDSPPTEFDYHCPLLSLPAAFATSLENIPSWPSYLQAAPDKLAEWDGLLGPRGLYDEPPKVRPRIGLVWRGNPDHLNDLRRSIPPDLLFAALPTEYEYICLQKTMPAVDRRYLAESPLPLRMFSEALHDFSDTAALCCQLDLIICVDTSVAHLAGALGRPTLLLLPEIPDWRWLLDRQDSPWYPSLRLIRQTEAGNWSSALAQLPAQIETILRKR